MCVFILCSDPGEQIRPCKCLYFCWSKTLHGPECMNKSVCGEMHVSLCERNCLGSCWNSPGSRFKKMQGKKRPIVGDVPLLKAHFTNILSCTCWFVYVYKALSRCKVDEIVHGKFIDGKNKMKKCTSCTFIHHMDSWAVWWACLGRFFLFYFFQNRGGKIPSSGLQGLSKQQIPYL